MIWEWIERAKPNGKRVSVYEMHGPFGMGNILVKCQSIGEWLARILSIFLVVAIVHDIDFHDIPFAKIISLSHDRVAA